MAEKRETRRSAQTRAMAKVDCWRWLSEWRETGRVTELGIYRGLQLVVINTCGWLSRHEAPP